MKEIPSSEKGSGNGKIRILLADDEPLVRMDLAQMLEELGYEVAGEASDGFDALERCRLLQPDAVLMDVKMPVFDGLTAAGHILAENLCRCVILLTAFNDEELIEKAAQTGVSAYLVKPVEQRLLRPTIEVALAQSRRLEVSAEETRQARQKVEDTRLIAQAQAILAEKEQIPEKEAYQLLRRLSMNKRTSMAVLARTLIQQKSGSPAAGPSAGKRKQENGRL